MKDILDLLTQYVDRENILTEEPMSKHTTFRTGGNAAIFVRVTNEEQLTQLLRCLAKNKVEYMIIGNGSNLLVGDLGYKGVILQIDNGFDAIEVDGNYIIAKAGARMSAVAKVACEHSLTGLEFASGIPGTVGGGVMMNAGAYDGEMKNVVTLVTLLNRAGEQRILDRTAMQFGYRTSLLKTTGEIVTEVIFELSPGDATEIKAKMDDFAERRRSKQPLEYPSAGSTFKRPAGHFAGKLIEDAGLRGYRIGGASVSEKHCGFIVNDRGASSAEIRELIDYVQNRVQEQSGVTLEPEVIFLGEF